jgi:hypothetical protein
VTIIGAKECVCARERFRMSPVSLQEEQENAVGMKGKWQLISILWVFERELKLIGLCSSHCLV